MAVKSKPPALLQGCDLPGAWGNRPAWRILETGFQDGVNFLTAWAAWKNDPLRPNLLHYVAITPDAPEPRQLEEPTVERLDEHLEMQVAQAVPSPRARLAELLADQCFGLLPGFHRLTFEQGSVLLTLCIGDLKTLLREQQFVADSVFLGARDAISDANHDFPAWNLWTVKSLARCCRRGTRVASGPITLALRQALSQSGFETPQTAPIDGPSETTGSDIYSGVYNPRWEPKTSRRLSALQAPLPGSCVVVGGGLAGASVAQALARRGWQVRVLDAALAPAAEASGVPVGLMVPHVSTDDSPRSRLSRAGIRLTLQQARALLVQGQDWGTTGVLERRPGGFRGLPPTWPAQAMAWSQPCNDLLADTAWGAGLPRHAPALWHASAAWIKPAQLVKAWLAQPGVQFQGGACVARIRRAGDAWVLLDAANKVLASANMVVLASAGGTGQLLEQLQNEARSGLGTGHDKPADAWASDLARALPGVPPLQAVSGQVSWALQRPADASLLPPYPVNGLGSLVAHVPISLSLIGKPTGKLSSKLTTQVSGNRDLDVGSDMAEDDDAAEGVAWFAGATYETPWAGSVPSIAQQHCANFARLQALLPACGHTLADQFNDGSLQAWRNTRHAPADHLPMVGPLMEGDSPTLWIITGLGSRGLSLSVLCAELLAARLGAEPLPLEARLAHKIYSDRKKGFFPTS